MSFIKDKRVFALKSLIHLLSLGLLINTFLLAVDDALGADPVEALLHFTGIGALNILMLTQPPL